MGGESTMASVIRRGTFLIWTYFD